MLTLPQLQALAASYGADPRRWRQNDRDAALALLRTSEAARALLEREAALDHLLSEATLRADKENWHEGEMDAAVARIRGAVGIRIRAGRTHASAGSPAGAGRNGFGLHVPVSARRLLAPVGPLGLAGVTTGVGFAVAVGLFVGWASVSQPASAGLLGLLQASPFNVLPL